MNPLNMPPFGRLLQPYLLEPDLCFTFTRASSTAAKTDTGKEEVEEDERASELTRARSHSSIIQHAANSKHGVAAVGLAFHPFS